ASPRAAGPAAAGRGGGGGGGGGGAGRPPPGAPPPPDADRLAELQELAERMERAADWAEFHRLDEVFHRTVAAATGVPAAAADYEPVLRDLYRYYLPYPMEQLRESNREHHELVAALRARDAAAAADVAHRHVTALHRDMFVGLDARRRLPPPARS
ncbi:FCD domain-containing protein, partial [Saccharopolyspora sp. 6M]|uniref:FCD domain-containing protein n=1 Tax=Saccharopolyspora sp. 6M TaxID=2877237 RepID=UPI001CD7B6E9